MTRIGPALAVIAAATTPDERARAGGGCARAVRARGATARPQRSGRDDQSAPCLWGH